MRNYQKIIFLMLLLIGGSIFYVQNLADIQGGLRNVLKEANILTVCDETLYYSLGEIDPRFDITKEDILKIANQAENVWESKLGKNVFEYREGAEFKINFIFDERQLRTVEKDNLDQQLDNLEYNKNNLSKEYQDKYASYNKALNTYEKKLADYVEQVEDFNREVEKWNKKDKMTKEKYEELKDDEGELAEIKDSLDKDRKKLNTLVAEVNKVVSKESALVENYNQKIETYKDKFGEAVEFNQGEYDGLSVNIYQFHEDNDLELVMAHELGHALGVGHVENSQSLMYYLMEDQDLENISLSNEDLLAIKEICKIK
jgi:chromosome segregation ATPase